MPTAAFRTGTDTPQGTEAEMEVVMAAATDGSFRIAVTETADLSAIRSIHEAAFGQSAEADLVEALVANGHAAISLAAIVEDRLIGHILLSRLVEPAGALALAPLAVSPECQRRGVGSALVRAAIGAARAGRHDAIFVLGSPDFYGRFGFSPEAARAFRCAYAGAHFMVLAPSGAPPAPGPVVYPPPFADLG
ncbi:MAG: N-acetyltransferase [Hyphomicrobiaceae bacterium]